MAEPITNVLGTVAIKHCGEYDATMHYEKLNVVTYNGSSYCAKDNTIGNSPINTTYWDLMSSKGDKGETGNDGHTPIKGVDYYTASDKADLEANLATDVENEVTGQLTTLSSATPLVASSTSGMTDTSRIYVNSSNGHWYWYNGSAWTDGGVYQSTGIDNDAVEYVNLDELLKSSYIQSINLVNRVKRIPNKYLNYNNGNTMDNPDYSVTDFIEVEPNTKYYLTNEIVPNIGAWRILEYDASKGYTNTYYNFSTSMLYITTGATTKYVRIAAKTSDYNYLFLTSEDIRQTYDKSKIHLNGECIENETLSGNSMKTKSLPIDSLKEFDIQSDNIYNSDIDYIAGKAINTDTGVDSISNVNYFTSDYFKIEPNTQYITNAERIGLYDNNYNFIEGYINRQTAFTTSSNAKFARISGQNSVRTAIQLAKGSTLSNDSYKYRLKGLEVVNNNEFVKSNIVSLLRSTGTLKIKLLGDSITHGVGGTGFEENGETIITSGGTTWKRNPNGYCWANLLKAELEDKYDCTVTNNGCSGTSSPFIVSNISTLIDDDDDVVICMIGTNNRITSSGFNSLYTDLQTIYNYCLDRNIKFIPMASVPASITDEERENGTFSVRYKHMEDINAVISAFANDNKLEYIDLFEPLYMYCFTKGVSFETLLKDGLHPNDDGYYLMYRIIMKGLGLVAKVNNATW